MGPHADSRPATAGAEPVWQAGLPCAATAGGPVQDTLCSFQQARRRHAAGVCIISEGRGSEVNGMVVTAATAFSMDPASVLVCVHKAASLSSRLQVEVPFGLAVLGRQHEAAAAFFRKLGGSACFLHGPWQMQPDEPPWLLDASANLLCVGERTMEYGSHMALIGAVQTARLSPDGPSLIHRDRTYG